MAKSSDQLAEAIRELRRQTGLTQVQLAGEVGLTPTTIYRYESGARPEPSALLALFAFAETHSLTTISNIFRSAIADRTDVPQSFFSHYSLKHAIGDPDEPPPDPLTEAAAHSMARLPQRDKVIALAFISFLRENTDLTADDVIRHLLQRWIDRAEKLFKTQSSDSAIPES